MPKKCGRRTRHRTMMQRPSSKTSSRLDAVTCRMLCAIPLAHARLLLHMDDVVVNDARNLESVRPGPISVQNDVLPCQVPLR